jgi:hypothetical protein
MTALLIALPSNLEVGFSFFWGGVVNLVQALVKYFSASPDEIQAELPLKRICLSL